MRAAFLRRSTGAYIIPVRDDIAEMYANAEFVLLPTHKTFQDAMEFRERAGYADRDEEDRFLLRPMTAVSVCLHVSCDATYA